MSVNEGDFRAVFQRMSARRVPARLLLELVDQELREDHAALG
jgi:hypothetical protein